MIYLPLSLSSPPVDTEEIVPPATSYTEPSISVLNIYDGSVFDVPMEEYLLGVVLAEMPASFNIEA